MKSFYFINCKSPDPIRVIGHRSPNLIDHIEEIWRWGKDKCRRSCFLLLHRLTFTAKCATLYSVLVGNMKIFEQSCEATTLLCVLIHILTNEKQICTVCTVLYICTVCKSWCSGALLTVSSESWRTVTGPPCCTEPPRNSWPTSLGFLKKYVQ